MTRRSRAREVALQLLFQKDANADVSRKAIEKFVKDRLGNAEAEKFCLALYDGVVEVLKIVDTRITAASDNWKLHRMAASDRNVLRLGTYELVHAKEPTPAPVALDEAIELARRYGSKDSASFVNGVLDKIFRVYSEEKSQSTKPVEAVVVESPG